VLTGHAETTSGLNLAGPGETLSISADMADHLFASLERMFGQFLAWAHDNPLLFMTFLIFLLLAYWVRRRSKVDEVSMKLEYNARRSTAKTQLPLPLPSIEEPPGGTK
jgi:hypothetical protein